MSLAELSKIVFGNFIGTLSNTTSNHAFQAVAVTFGKSESDVYWIRILLAGDTMVIAADNLNVSVCGDYCFGVSVLDGRFFLQSGQWWESLASVCSMRSWSFS